MKDKFLFFILALIILFSFSFLNNTNVGVSTDISHCKDLNYNKQIKIKPENFSKVQLKIKFLNERDWRTTNLRDHINSKKLGKVGWGEHFTNRERSKAEITILNENLTCKVNARIRAHGDMLDHRDGSGLPSLNVALDDGHIFGITRFLLLRPNTRGYDSEIFSTTLISNLGFLSPRTASARVEYNDLSYNFIFQEKIQKEFLEFNNLKEGPIFDGDERFLFIDPIDNLEFKKHKLVNENWIKKNKEKAYISLMGFSKLNKIQTMYDAKYTQFVVDYAELARQKKYNKLFEDIEIYDAVVFATRSEHALSMNDRIFYYDHNYKKFLPIFYDGGSKLLNKYNQISTENFATSNNLVEKSNLVNGRVSYSSVIGAKKASDRLKNLDRSKLLRELNERGFKINKKNLEEILNKIDDNLDKLESFSNSRIFEVNVKKIDKSLNQRRSYNKGFERKLVFFDEYFDNFLECLPEDNSSCKKLDNSKTNLTKLLSQKLKVDNYHLVFYGKKNVLKNDGGWFHEYSDKKNFNKYQKNESYFSNDLNFFTYGAIKYNLDKNNKILNISKNSEYGTIFIYDSNLENWKISFQNNFQSNNSSRIDFNFLTGCINIYDSYFKNLSIESQNNDCEDSVNIVRSEGQIDYLNIKNAKFDALDFDFSKLKIKNIIVSGSNNDCLDVSYGLYEIDNLNVSMCGDKGLSVGENSNIVVKKLIAENVNIGLASKDNARATVNNFLANAVKDCVRAYNKKQEFSGGYVNIKMLKCTNYENIQVKDPQSKILIN